MTGHITILPDSTGDGKRVINPDAVNYMVFNIKREDLKGANPSFTLKIDGINEFVWFNIEPESQYADSQSKKLEALARDIDTASRRHVAECERLREIISGHVAKCEKQAREIEMLRKGEEPAKPPHTPDPVLGGEGSPGYAGEPV